MFLKRFGVSPCSPSLLRGIVRTPLTAPCVVPFSVWKNWNLAAIPASSPRWPGTAPGFNGDGGPATSAQANLPSAVAVDAQGDLFIADTANNVIREVKAGTGVITTVAGNGTAGFSGDGGCPDGFQ
jgi:hypothetical protein